MKALPILIVEDDADLREALCDTVELAGYQAIGAGDGHAALKILHQQPIGLVVSDVQMQPMDGHTLLREIKSAHPYVPVLLMTAYGMIDKAVEAMRAGACHYLTKPFEPDRLLAEVARYMLPSLSGDVGEVVAQDPHMVEVLNLARRVAVTDATVLLTGESGTGKEVVARFIHRHSARAEKPFIAINCAAIPENLLESTLFGFEKGAFTGATQTQPGKFEQAQEGTLLLDEVTEMPLPLQAKFLRVLQEREVERVGGRRTIPLDIRVIATSNRDMATAVEKNEFREDLYYRLNVFPLELPPLRKRPLDIVALACSFLGRLAARVGRHGMKLSPDAEKCLELHNWPGNIRELENVVQRAMILAPGSTIEVEHLLLPQHALPPAASSAGMRGDMDMKSLEKTHIMETLAAVKGARKQAAEKLGMSERTLRYKLRQYREEDGVETP